MWLTSISHFVDEETEAQRGEFTYSRSHSNRCGIPRSCVLNVKVKGKTSCGMYSASPPPPTPPPPNIQSPKVTSMSWDLTMDAHQGRGGRLLACSDHNRELQPLGGRPPWGGTRRRPRASSCGALLEFSGGAFPGSNPSGNLQLRVMARF